MECAYHAGHAYAEIGESAKALAQLRFYLQNADVDDPGNADLVLESQVRDRADARRQTIGRTKRSPSSKRSVLRSALPTEPGRPTFAISNDRSIGCGCRSSLNPGYSGKAAGFTCTWVADRIRHRAFVLDITAFGDCEAPRQKREKGVVDQERLICRDGDGVVRCNDEARELVIGLLRETLQQGREVVCRQLHHVRGVKVGHAHTVAATQGPLGMLRHAERVDQPQDKRGKGALARPW